MSRDPAFYAFVVITLIGLGAALVHLWRAATIRGARMKNVGFALAVLGLTVVVLAMFVPA